MSCPFCFFFCNIHFDKKIFTNLISIARRRFNAIKSHVATCKYANGVWPVHDKLKRLFTPAGIYSSKNNLITKEQQNTAEIENVMAFHTSTGQIANISKKNLSRSQKCFAIFFLRRTTANYSKQWYSNDNCIEYVNCFEMAFISKFLANKIIKSIRLNTLIALNMTFRIKFNQ